MEKNNSGMTKCSHPTTLKQNYTSYIESVMTFSRTPTWKTLDCSYLKLFFFLFCPDKRKMFIEFSESLFHGFFLYFYFYK